MDKENFRKHLDLEKDEIYLNNVAKLGISEKTVEGHLTKGLKALRLSLKNSLNIF